MRKLLLASILLVPAFANAQLLWNQGPASNGIAYVSDGISTNGSQPWSSSLADNFSLAATSNVTGLSFWGGSEGYSSLDLSNFTSFDIEIYNSDFSQAVFSQNVSTASLNATLSGGTDVNGFTGTTAPEYKFTLSGLNLNLGPGTYWLAVGSVNADPIGDGFDWTTANADGLYAVNAFDGNGWQTYSDTVDPNQDQAFQIYGAPTPEPATLTLLTLSGLALLRRRSK